MRDAEVRIPFDGAFHGRTLGALSLNRSKAVYRSEVPRTSGIHDVEYSEAGVERLRSKLDADTGHIPPEEVAFLILEPIQGEGGYRVPHPEFLSAVDDLCREHDIPVIADEIQSGVGRTGEMWAVDHYDIEPDVITSAKALRVGATVSRSDMFPSETSRLSSTWGAGDILGSIRGALTLAPSRTTTCWTTPPRSGRTSWIGSANSRRAVRWSKTCGGLDLMTPLEFDTAGANAVMEPRSSTPPPLGVADSSPTPPALDVTEREGTLSRPPHFEHPDRSPDQSAPSLFLRSPIC